MKKHELAYLSCPYNHADVEIRKRRLFFANLATFQLMEQGTYVYSPLTHNIPLNQMGLYGNWDLWRDYDLMMVSKCDKLILLKLEGWEASQGVKAELEHAQKLGIPIIERDVPLEKTLETPFDLDSLQSLLHRMLEFYKEREWEQFHSPKNVAMDLACEVGEILDHFRWLTEEESYRLNEKTLQEVTDEIGDAFKALVYLSAKLGIDPVKAAHKKLIKMAEKYPVHLCKGKCNKHTDYASGSLPAPPAMASNDMPKKSMLIPTNNPMTQ